MNEGTFSTDLTVLSAWPPDTNTRLFEGIANGSTLAISANANGTLQLEVHTEANKLLYETPRLVLPDFAFLKIAFSWGLPKGIVCAINGVLINEIDGELVTLTAASHPPTHFRTQRTFSIPPRCDDVEESYLRFMLDLQARVSTATPFDLREASAILRRLLLDARPVIHLVNRTYRQKIQFPFVEERPINVVTEKPVFQFLNLCPNFADPAEIRTLTLNEFLATPVLQGQERSFSVRDVIAVCANLKGGIHFGEPVTQDETALVKLDKNYLPFFVDASYAALPGIAWTTINGTQALTDTLLKGRSA